MGSCVAISWKRYAITSLIEPVAYSMIFKVRTFLRTQSNFLKGRAILYLPTFLTSLLQSGRIYQQKADLTHKSKCFAGVLEWLNCNNSCDILAKKNTPIDRWGVLGEVVYYTEKRISLNVTPHEIIFNIFGAIHV